MILDNIVWNGKVKINDTVYPDIDTAREAVKNEPGSLSNIVLFNDNEIQTERKNLRSNDNQEYAITVRKYMTKRATPEFNFMAQWNNDIPMPLMTMVGTVEKETRGMVYMKLHGDIVANQYCMKCGKPITNPISQLFGMGPECGQHNYVNPFESDEELDKAIEDYRKNHLQKIVWEGWIIKSAITNQELYKKENSDYEN